MSAQQFWRLRTIDRSRTCGGADCDRDCRFRACRCSTPGSCSLGGEPLTELSSSNIRAGPCKAPELARLTSPRNPGLDFGDAARLADFGLAGPAEDLGVTTFTSSKREFRPGWRSENRVSFSQTSRGMIPMATMEGNIAMATKTASYHHSR